MHHRLFSSLFFALSLVILHSNIVMCVLHGMHIGLRWQGKRNACSWMLPSGIRWLFRILWPVFVFIIMGAGCWLLLLLLMLFIRSSWVLKRIICERLLAIQLDAKVIFSTILVAIQSPGYSRLQNYTKYCNFPFQPKHIMCCLPACLPLTIQNTMRYTVRYFHPATTTIMFLMLLVIFHLSLEVSVKYWKPLHCNYL